MVSTKTHTHTLVVMVVVLTTSTSSLCALSSLFHGHTNTFNGSTHTHTLITVFTLLFSVVVADVVVAAAAVQVLRLFCE